LEGKGDVGFRKVRQEGGVGGKHPPDQGRDLENGAGEGGSKSPETQGTSGGGDYY